jgi:hypothetical protein
MWPSMSLPVFVRQDCSLPFVCYLIFTPQLTFSHNKHTQASFQRLFQGQLMVKLKVFSLFCLFLIPSSQKILAHDLEKNSSLSLYSFPLLPNLMQTNGSPRELSVSCPHWHCQIRTWTSWTYLPKLLLFIFLVSKFPQHSWHHFNALRLELYSGWLCLNWLASRYLYQWRDQ